MSRPDLTTWSNDDLDWIASAAPEERMVRVLVNTLKRDPGHQPGNLASDAYWRWYDAARQRLAAHR